MTTTFANFLHNHGILSAKQTENYPERNDDQDNPAIVFQLADFFKSLTPSDCYDLALRLYLLYKKQLEKPKFDEKQISKLNKMIETLSQVNRRWLNFGFEKISTVQPPLKTFEGSFRQEPSSFLHGKHTRTKSFSTHYFHSDDANNSILNTSSIHERLYNESAALNTSKLLNEEKKYMNEIKGCTFQPNASARKKSLDSSSDVFKRLQRDYRRESEHLREAVKVELELMGCTFQPNTTKASGNSSYISNASNVSEFQYPSTKLLSNTFERLHNESAYKKRQKIENEMLKQSYELAGCSFTPRINSSRRPSVEKDIRSAREASTQRSEYLYADHFDKKRNATLKAFARQEESLNECTFKPKLVAKTPESLLSGRKGNSYDRMAEWEKEKNEKIAEKRRQKELEEAATVTSPMINLISRGLSSNSTEPAHERLYRYHDEKKQKHTQLQQKFLSEAGATFTPKTNVKRPMFTSNAPKNASEKTEEGEQGQQQYFSTNASRNQSPNKYEELQKLKERLRGKPFVSVSSHQNTGEDSGQYASNDNKENTGNSVNTKTMSPSDHKKIFQQSNDHKHYFQGAQSKPKGMPIFTSQASQDSFMNSGDNSMMRKNESIRPFNLGQLNDSRQQQSYRDISFDDNEEQF